MMTQTEYENPDRHSIRPSRAPMGSVVIERFHMWKHEYMFAGELVEVRIYDLCLFGAFGWGPYRTDPKYNGPRLYSMDGDGNIKSPSVFREPLEATNGI